jgi:hypothetical protein
LECTFLNVSFNSPATQRVACSQRFSQGDGCVISTTPKTSKSSFEKICSKHNYCGKNHLQLVGLSLGLPKYCIYTWGPDICWLTSPVLLVPPKG